MHPAIPTLAIILKDHLREAELNLQAEFAVFVL